MSINTFQNVSVVDTTSTNNFVANQAIINNTLVTTSFTVPSLSTNYLNNYTSNELRISSANLITLNAPNVWISGNTTYSNVDNLLIKDKIITLNKSGLSVGNCGIEIESGNSIVGSITAIGNASIDYWNLTQPLNITGNLTSSNINTGNISAGNLSTSNISCNNIISNSLSLTGNVVINGNVLVNENLYSGNGKNLFFNSANLNVSSVIYARDVDQTLYIQSGTFGNVGTSSNIFIGDYFQSSINSNRKIMIKADGNVGIGTSTPNDKFVVSGGNLVIQTNAFNGLKISSGYKETTPTSNYTTYEIGGSDNYHYFWDNIEASGNITANSGFRFPSSISNLSQPWKIVNVKDYLIGPINAGAVVNFTIPLGYTFSNTAFMHQYGTISGGVNGEACSIMTSIASTSSVIVWIRNNGGSQATLVKVNIMVVGFQ